MAFLGRRKQQRLFELERARVARRMANEDVTALGEELSELDGDVDEDVGKALDAYNRAKKLLRTTEGPG